MSASASFIIRKGILQSVRSSKGSFRKASVLLNDSLPVSSVLTSAGWRHHHSQSGSKHLCTNTCKDTKKSDLIVGISYSPGHNVSSTLPPLVSADPSQKLQYSTFNAQKDSLPRLPVPDLHDTIRKFLKSAHPLVSPEEFATTENIVNEFIKPGGEGEQLQQYLVKRAAEKDNWMSDWWVDTAYFKFRMPVVVWSSPGLVFPAVQFSNENEQLNYAARMIAGALDYKRLLDSDSVPIERMGRAELDMSQYSKIFSTCRIPGLTKDSLVYHSQDPDPPRHIVVMHKNHFFKLDVYGKSGKQLSAAQLKVQLQNILGRSTRHAVPIGILSSQNRNVWGQAYKTLLKASKSNVAHAGVLNRAMFVVCLDTAAPPSTGNRMTDVALQCLHGGGSEGNSANRWFDKTIQFIVGPDGRVGLTYEHSPAEGPPIANLMDHIIEYMASDKPEQSLLAVELSKPQRLQFTVPQELEAEMDRAKQVLDSLVDDLAMTCFSFTGFGKDFIKTQKISPDSFIQMAIQLAFYRIHKEPGAQYESASTRMFLHGRTETIRSCSEESVAFCRAMVEGGSLKQRRDALMAAVAVHKGIVQEAVSGRGVDRHLLGLKLAAIENGLDVPPLFMDVSYIRSSHMRLSTSQVPAKCEAFMCYGPLVPDGYGCCYNPRADSIIFGTSSLNSSPETDSATFREALESSLSEMRDLLLTPVAKL